MNFYEECIYNQAYDKALLDIKNWFERHSISLKNNRLYNQKGISMLIKAFLDNRDIFRKYGEDTEFILSEDKKVIKISNN